MNRKTRYFVIASLLVLTVGVGTGLVAYYVGFPDRVRAAGPGRAPARPRQRRRWWHTPMCTKSWSRTSASGSARPCLNLPDGQREFEQPPASTSKPTSTASSPLSRRRRTATFDVPRSGLIIASGRFDQVRIEALMREHGASEETYKGRRLFVAPARRAPALSLAFVEPGLVAVGGAALVRAAIDRRDGGDSVRGNDDIMGLVRSLDRGNVWAVGRFDALTSQANLPPHDRRVSCRRLPGSRSAGTSTAGSWEMCGWRRATRSRRLSSATSFAASSRWPRCRPTRTPSSNRCMRSIQLGGSGKTVAVSFELPAAALDRPQQASRPSQAS